MLSVHLLCQPPGSALPPLFSDIDGATFAFTDLPATPQLSPAPTAPPPSWCDLPFPASSDLAVDDIAWADTCPT